MATITKRKNSYHIMVSEGYDTAGKQIRKCMNWTPPEGMTERQIQKTLQEKAALFEREVKQGKVLDGNITFKEFTERWLKDYGETQLAPITLSGYKSLFTRINPAIGHIRLDKLQPQHLLELYARLAKEQNKNSNTYIATDILLAKRIEKGMTRENISQISDISINTVQNAFQQKPVAWGSAEKICKALKLKMTQGFTPTNPNKTISNKTIKSHHRFISAVLNQAVYWQIIHSNPASRIKPPKVEKTEAKYLDEKETSKLILLLENEPIKERTMIKLFIFSGMRRGELCGLEWKDIDFDNNMIRIERASQYLPSKGIFTKKPKTASSKRMIKLPKQAFDMLSEYKIWQNKERLKMGDAWVETGRLFTQSNGESIHPDTITKWFTGFISKTDLPKVTVHQLRHSNLTLLIAAGIPLPTVAKRAGHSNTNTTTTIYAHAIKTMDEMAAEVLEDIFTPAKPKRLLGSM